MNLIIIAASSLVVKWVLYKKRIINRLTAVSFQLAQGIEKNHLSLSKFLHLTIIGKIRSAFKTNYAIFGNATLYQFRHWRRICAAAILAAISVLALYW